jgi:hypothetical protein
MYRHAHFDTAAQVPCMQPPVCPVRGTTVVLPMNILSPHACGLRMLHFFMFRYYLASTLSLLRYERSCMS